MIKTVSLTANQETEVILAGGCHCCIENRGSGVIYASKTSGIIADSDGVTAIDSGNSKVLRNIAQYKKDDNLSYDYYGKIYLLSDSDGKAEIQTANDLSFKLKNSAKGGGTYDDTAIKADISELQSGIVDLQTEKADKSEVYTKSETDSKITSKVAEIVADAPEDFDTLKEMSDWIASHENSASAMNSAIQTNADNISNLQENKANASDLNNYVTKITGKGLSSNDYTTAEKNKLAGIENYDDTALKSNVALNLSSIGMSKKNLLKNTARTVIKLSEVIFTTNNDKSVTMSGSCASTTGIFLPTVYLDVGSYILSTGINTPILFQLYEENETTYISNHTVTNQYTLNITEPKKYAIKLIAQKGVTYNNVTIYPMLRYADITDGTYEPYTEDLQTQINNNNNDIALNLSSIGMSKKNLLPFPQTITKGGITFTCDTNGYMSASNTSSDIRQFSVSNAQYSVNLKAGKYILSFVSSTVCTNAYGNIMILSGEGTTIASIGQKNYANKTSGSVEFTLDTEQTIYVMSKMFDGVTAVMIRYADITDNTYEPYHDDLQTQINAILTRLTALEGGT